MVELGNTYHSTSGSGIDPPAPRLASDPAPALPTPQLGQGLQESLSPIGSFGTGNSTSPIVPVGGTAGLAAPKGPAPPGPEIAGLQSDISTPSGGSAGGFESAGKRDLEVAPGSTGNFGVGAGPGGPDDTKAKVGGAGSTADHQSLGGQAETLTAKTSATAGAAKDTATDTANRASASAAEATQQAKATAADATTRASNVASDVSARATSTAQSVSAKASETAQGVVTGLRKRVNSLSKTIDHAGDDPRVQHAKEAAGKQTQQLREVLGRNELILDAEKRTGIDRVVLVVGGLFAYIILIPLNLFGLALPTTNFLTYVPPTYFALDILEKKHTTGNDERVKVLLTYFVSLGFIQLLESLAAGVLEKRIPQYYTVKLLFLAYLLHPRTQGAIQLQDRVFSRLVKSQSKGQAVNTPPTTHHAPDSTQNSPKYAAPATSTSTSGSGPADAGFGSKFSVPPVTASPSTASTGGDKVHLPSGPGTGQGYDIPK